MKQNYPTCLRSSSLSLMPFGTGLDKANQLLRRLWHLPNFFSRLKVFLSSFSIYKCLTKFLRRLVMFLKINYIPNSSSLAENELLVRCAAAKTLIKVPGASCRHRFLFSGTLLITITWPSEEDSVLSKIKMLPHSSFYKITEC